LGFNVSVVTRHLIDDTHGTELRLYSTTPFYRVIGHWYIGIGHVESYIILSGGNGSDRVNQYGVS